VDVISRLLDGNRRFVAGVFAQEQAYFAELAKAQRPTVLWIGCSDSRVAVDIITDTRPGEVFVHRNIGNVVAVNDWNLLAVLEYSVNYLHIPDAVVCGHYGCGGIAALDEEDREDRYIPVWLLNAFKAKDRVDEKIRGLHTELTVEQRRRLIVEENVRLQLEHLHEYPFVRRVREAGKLRTHGWVYDMETGEIRVVEES
jgi:carbonic anhydrase